MVNSLALGFRVKSGFAVAVALSGSAAAPVFVGRRVVELSDPAIPETKQPYHAGVGAAQEDERAIARLTAIVEQSASRSVEALLAEDLFASRRYRAALVVGSVIDPAQIANPHIRAHANEGRLFRTALEGALRTRGITCSVLVEKTLAATAAKAVSRTPVQIRTVVEGLAKGRAGPWRAEEKAAATAAWMVL